MSLFNKPSVIALLAAVTVFGVGSLLLLGDNESGDNNANQTTNEEHQIAEEVETTAHNEDSANKKIGTITGSYVYPSQTIPGSLIACATDTASKTETCSDKQIKSDEFVNGVGYEVNVAPGQYEVFARNIGNGENAYYNSYVKDFTEQNQWPNYPSCNQVSTLEVTVHENKITKDITLGDWYYSSKCS